MLRVAEGPRESVQFRLNSNEMNTESAYQGSNCIYTCIYIYIYIYICIYIYMSRVNPRKALLQAYSTTFGKHPHLGFNSVSILGILSLY